LKISLHGGLLNGTMHEFNEYPGRVIYIPWIASALGPMLRAGLPVTDVRPARTYLIYKEKAEAPTRSGIFEFVDSIDAL